MLSPIMNIIVDYLKAACADYKFLLNPLKAKANA